MQFDHVSLALEQGFNNAGNAEKLRSFRVLEGKKDAMYDTLSNDLRGESDALHGNKDGGPTRAGFPRN